MFRYLLALVFVSLGFLSNPGYAQEWSIVTTSDGSAPTARHESNAVVYNGMIYFFGGRGLRPVDRYNPTTNVWETIATAPVEMHHFQPVLYNDKVYIIGAFSCCFPLEPTIPDIHVFDLINNSWSIVGTMPIERLRGSPGTVLHNNKIYVIGGNTNGHSGGAVPWFDEFDPATGIWTTLPDAPTARDHFGATIIGDTLIATAGRQSNNSFAFTVPGTDLFDFATNQWTRGADIPTNRAGTNTVVYEELAIIIGGETTTGAHNTVEAYNPATNEWRALPVMIRGRHAGGAVLIGTNLHVFAGSTTRGGIGESNFHEVIDLALVDTTFMVEQSLDTDSDGLSDVDELNIFFTNINLADTDSDGLNDYDEINTHGTDPNNIDSDSDNLTDGDEVSIYFTSPNNTDSDADGVSDGDELDTYSTDPLQADSDNDGISDGIEISELGSNPLSTDSDNDGLSDGVEFTEHGTNPTAQDSDADGLTDPDEISIYSSNPTSNDSDNDGVSDGQEVLVYQSNPNSNDTDGDGVTDGQEVASGSNLTNIDEDNDGLINSRDGLLDTDGDGLPNFADRDSDNDGIPDLIELGYSDINSNGQLDTQADWDELQQNTISPSEPGSNNTFTAPTTTSIAIDTDNDGIPDYIDLDSDQDGIPDRAEAVGDYTNSDAVIQLLEDANNDGLNDSYTVNASNTPSNDDNDSQPNHLDLDSDNDGIYDLVETGSPDIDDNGRVDNFVDSDQDGLTDSGRPTLGNALPDEDNDSVPDLIDAEFNEESGSGCTLTATSSTDPLFITMLILSFAGLARTRRRTKASLH